MTREEKITQLFHDLYEQESPDFEYKTREDTKTLDFNSPNGQLMLSVVSKVINQIDNEWKKQIKEYILDEHIHFDKLDPWQFEDEKPYVDSLKLETFINNIIK